ncbi:MAG: hypothetical protein WCH83_17920 [Alphaproteobacteria bacterium]
MQFESSRLNALTLISIVVSLLALGSSFVQNYNYARNLQIVQRNVIRSEYLRTCRDIIDAYFAVKQLGYALNEGATATPPTLEPGSAREAEAHVFKFAALGTFLANFRDDRTRESYTKLSWALLEIVRETYKGPRADFDKAYGAADASFGEINEDCAKTARLEYL